MGGSEPYPTEGTKLRSEGYSSLKKWKENMDAFGEATRGNRDPIDSMRDVDPNLVRSAFRER